MDRTAVGTAAELVAVGVAAVEKAVALAGLKEEGVEAQVAAPQVDTDTAGCGLERSPQRGSCAQSYSRC